ncbi:MAG: twin-arginine translocase TatA/TatE family subunit [Myxococcales bacterium]|nr:twin-arginine translocase TatA/TatE family subunit [Myxococcales bacterium]
MEEVFGLGFWEIAFILGVALLVFGPSKLPELAKTLGRGLREFRNATDDFRSTIDAELHDDKPYRPEPKKLDPEQLPETIAREGDGTAGSTAGAEPTIPAGEDAAAAVSSAVPTESQVSDEDVSLPSDSPVSSTVKKA